AFPSPRLDEDSSGVVWRGDAVPCEQAASCDTSAETGLAPPTGNAPSWGLMATKQMGRGIVLACQGGGSHTAFTAGVLEELLAHDDRDIRALSGTSGGAVCAFLAWSGLLIGGKKGRNVGVARLERYWDRLRTHGVVETLQDAVGINALRGLGSLGLVLEFSPYLNVFEASRDFKRLIEDVVRFDEISISSTSPRLLISAADVRTGEFRVFRSHAIDQEPADEITSG